MSVDDDFDPIGAVEPDRTSVEIERERLALARQRKTAIREASVGRTEVDANEFTMPVNMNFLARVLKIDPMTVKKRLAKCEPIGLGGGNRPVYDFRRALEYLIVPRMDLTDFISTLNPIDLPNSINKTFWEAQRIRLKYELEASQAWATSDVLEVFGETFMAIKARTQLWVESLRDQGFEDVVVEKMREMTDQLLKDLYETLLEMPKKRQTRPKIKDMDKMDLTNSEFPE